MKINTPKDIEDIAKAFDWSVKCVRHEGKWTLQYTTNNGQIWYGDNFTLAKQLATHIREQARLVDGIIQAVRKAEPIGIYNDYLSYGLLNIATALEKWIAENGPCEVCKGNGGTNHLASIWCGKCKNYVKEPYCYHCGKKAENYKRCNCEG